MQKHPFFSISSSSQRRKIGNPSPIISAISGGSLRMCTHVKVGRIVVHGRPQEVPPCRLGPPPKPGSSTISRMSQWSCKATAGRGRGGPLNAKRLTPLHFPSLASCGPHRRTPANRIRQPAQCPAATISLHSFCQRLRPGPRAQGRPASTSLWPASSDNAAPDDKDTGYQDSLTSPLIVPGGAPSSRVASRSLLIPRPAGSARPGSQISM